MFASFSIAPVLGRPSDPVTRLATALLGMLAVNPLFILDGGFALSFQASAGILLLAPPLQRLFGVDRLCRIKPRASWTGNLALRAAKYFPQLLCSTLAAQLATLPTIIEFFGSQPLIAIPVNLLAIPLSMYAYPIALIALALSVVWMPLAQLAAAGANLLFSMLVEVVNWFSALPPGAIHAPHYPGWLTAAHYALMIAASGMSRASLRIRRFLPVGLAGLIGVSILCARVQTAGFQVVFLDAGQADAAVVRTEGHVYLFDTGDLYSPVTDYVTASCLGVDAVFLSHPHYDHAGGLAELIEEMPPGTIYVPEGWFEADASDTVQAGIDLAGRRASRSSSCPPEPRSGCPTMPSRESARPPALRLRSTTFRWSSRWRIAKAACCSPAISRRKASRRRCRTSTCSRYRITVRRRRAATGCWRS